MPAWSVPVKGHNNVRPGGGRCPRSTARPICGTHAPRAWQPQRPAAVHACPADHDVLERHKHGVPHVQRPRHVRRRHANHERLAVALGREVAALLPPGKQGEKVTSAVVGADTALRARDAPGVQPLLRGRVVEVLGELVSGDAWRRGVCWRRRGECEWHHRRRHPATQAVSHPRRRCSSSLRLCMRVLGAWGLATRRRSGAGPGRLGGVLPLLPPVPALPTRAACKTRACPAAAPRSAHAAFPAFWRRAAGCHASSCCELSARRQEPCCGSSSGPGASPALLRHR